MDQVQLMIKKVLPSLTPESLASVLVSLKRCGVEGPEDFGLVEERDLSGCLKPIEMRKLLLSFKCGGYQYVPTLSPPLSTQSMASPSLVETPCSTRPCTTSVEVDHDWVARFVIPECSMSRELRAGLALNGRLCLRLRRELVRKLVDEAMFHCRRPVKRDIRKIALQVVTKYPKQLADVFDNNVVIGSGHDSLVEAMMSRIENMNRPALFTTSSVIRRKRTHSADQSQHQLTVLNGFGCVNWSPSIPDNETPETQLYHKMALKLMNNRGQWNIDDVKRLSAKAYFLQRQDINNCMTVVDLLSDWPFLFNETIFNWHANKLLGFDVNSRLVNAVQDKGPRLIAFFRTQKFMQQCPVLQQLDCMTVEAHRRHGQQPIAFAALLAYMKEDLSSLCRGAETTSTKEDMEQLALPATPCLLFRGSSMLEAKDFAVSIERKVVFDCLSFVRAFCLFFSAYFVLNMEYPTEAAATMEFIQRCFAQINPTNGTKVKPQKGKKTSGVPPKVLCLINQLADFELQNSQ